MGQCFVNGLSADGVSFPDPDFHKNVATMVELAEKQNVTPRERKHVKAVEYLAVG